MGLSPSFVFQELPAALPHGFVPALLNSSEGFLRVALILNQQPKPGTSPLVLLRDTLRAKVYLAALVDAANRVHQWLEFSVQDSAGASQAPLAYQEALTNEILDAAWAASSDALGYGISTGFERSHPAPLFLDSKSRLAITPKDKRTGGTWQLCTDEKLIAATGQPAYGSTRTRHLYQPEQDGTGDLMPIDMLGNDPAALSAALGLPSDLIPVNPGCGLLSLTPMSMMTLEQYADAIKGNPSDAGEGDSVLRTILAASGRTASPSGPGGFLRLSGVGGSGRIVETLHLQLMAVAQAVQSVRAWTNATQAPLLNIDVGSFGVALVNPAFALPYWWTARTRLVIGGDAAQLSIPGAKSSYFLPGRQSGSSIFTASSMARGAGGKGFFSPRKVIPESTGQIIEGTLRTNERISAGPQDLLWIRGGTGDNRFDLYTFVDQESALTTGELRLRSLPQKFSEQLLIRLRTGTPISDVTFELVPMFSTPCDLYALGVLAVRVLLVDAKRGLPVALDEMFSLAAAAAALAENGEDLRTRIGQVFASDRRFPQSLGPQNILGAGAEDAASAVPPTLWFGVLATIIRMFTGIGPDSRCKDFGAAPQGAIQRVFDPTLEELHALLGACRTLIVPDHALSTEVRAVLESCAASLR